MYHISQRNSFESVAQIQYSRKEILTQLTAGNQPNGSERRK